LPKADSIPRADLAAAAKKLKTPFYYYDARVIRSRYAALLNALPSGWRLFYAAKANPNIAVLKIYRKMGAVAECASAGEMLACRKAGFKGQNTVLSGPVKGEGELALIRKTRPFMIHAETVTELAALERLGKKIDVALRLNLDLRIPRNSAGRVMTGGKDKFGFSPEDAEKVLKGRGKYRNLNFRGFHIYMGTQIREADTWLKGARAFALYAAALSKKHGLKPSYINFGGGLGIPYRHGERAFDLKALAKGLAGLHREFCGIEELKGASFHIEPGRYLMGPAGYYVMKIVSLKKMRGVNFALTDGGIHHALLPFRVSREFPAIAVGGAGGKKEQYILGGPLCTTLDQSDLPVLLPRIREGDTIAIHNSGAYGYGTGMHFFLSHPLPAEVLKDGGSFRLIRKPSTSGHLFRYQGDRKL